MDKDTIIKLTEVSEAAYEAVKFQLYLNNWLGVIVIGFIVLISLFIALWLRRLPEEKEKQWHAIPGIFCIFVGVPCLIVLPVVIAKLILLYVNPNYYILREFLR